MNGERAECRSPKLIGSTVSLSVCTGEAWGLPACKYAEPPSHDWTPQQPSRGLGDTIAKLTSAVGIKPCDGCKGRQAKLNALLPYRVDPPQAQPATINRLAVVTSYFNPAGFRRLRDNWHRFRDGMAGAEVVTAELAFDDDEWDLPDGPEMLRFRGSRERNCLWQKERLINLAVQSLPADVDAVAWIDADILFARPDWLAATMDALTRHQVVQPWEHAVKLRRDGKPERTRYRSTASRYARDRRRDGPSRSHPGYAWAARIGWLRRHGLYDRHVLGSGDSLMLPGLYGGEFDATFAAKMSPAWRDHGSAWCERANADIGGTLGFVPGAITHLYHGETKHRRYFERWAWLKEGGYDPASDVEVDAHGLLRWTDEALRDKAAMVERARGYFAGRREDD